MLYRGVKCIDVMLSVSGLAANMIELNKPLAERCVFGWMIDWNGSLATEVCHYQVNRWVSGSEWVDFAHPWIYTSSFKNRFECLSVFETSFGPLAGVWYPHQPVSRPKEDSWFWKVLQWDSGGDQTHSGAGNRYNRILWVLCVFRAGQSHMTSSVRITNTRSVTYTANNRKTLFLCFCKKFFYVALAQFLNKRSVHSFGQIALQEWRQFLKSKSKSVPKGCRNHCINPTVWFFTISHLALFYEAGRRG